MTNDQTIVEFSEPIALAGLEEQWEKGDRFALVEAIALCSENGWDHPQWVTDLVNAAATTVFRAVYPNHNLDRVNPRDTRDQADLISARNVSERLEKSRSDFLSVFGLSTAKDNAVKIRDRLLRDAYLAEEVARRCSQAVNIGGAFKGINKAIEEVTLIVVDDSERKEKSALPAVCRGASTDVITRAWRKHSKAILQFYSMHPEEICVPLAWFLFEPDPTD